MGLTKVELFKEMNTESNRAIEFEFLDLRGDYATVTKKPFVKVLVHMASGYTFEFTKAEFESLGEYKINCGIMKASERH